MKIKSSNPAVSVVVPVLNRRDLVLRSLESIRRQTYRPIELIVVDNGSTDATKETVEHWKKKAEEDDFKIKILSEDRKGACFARNKGLEEATGEYLMFFDSDDEMRPSLIKDAIESFNSDDTPDIVCWKCSLHLLDGKTRLPAFTIGNETEGHFIHSMMKTVGYMARRDLFLVAGGWKSLKGWDDWELGIRLLLLSPRIKAIDKVLVDVYSQAESITGENFSSKEGIWEEALEMAKQNVSNSSHPLKEKMMKMLDYREIILAADYHKEGNREAARRQLAKALKNGKGLRRNAALLFSYHYTRKGGRGAWRIIRKIY